MSQGFATGIQFYTHFGLVTSLPTSPAVGDRCTYKADNTNGIFWELVYDASGSYPWKYVGGAPLINEVDTDESTTSTTYANLATTGPSLTTPLAGDFIIEHGMESYCTAATIEGYMSYAIGGSAAVDADYISSYMPTSGYSTTPARSNRQNSIAASTAFVCKYKVNGGTGQFRKRWLKITPVRVG